MHLVRSRSIRLFLAAAAISAAVITGVGAGTAQAATQTVAPAVKSVEATGAPVSAGTGRAWDGPAVAVIDSGVDPHVDYNLKSAIDCTGLGSGNDGNGHGTGVAGMIAAIDNSQGIVGIAPGAPIYSVRVLDSKLSGSVSTVSCGLQWVLANASKYNIKVANMSLAYPGTDDGNCGQTNNDVIHQEICQLAAAGVTVVGSAGNETEDFGKLVPAAYDEVLTATDVADYDGIPGGKATAPCTSPTADDTAYKNSNYAVSAADKAHVVAAPGVCPYTTKKGNQYGYIQSGTSMSAAVVSGVVLDCLRPGGTCVGETVPQIRATIMDEAAAAAARGHVFHGDPLHPIAGTYFGYEVSTAQDSGGGLPTVPTTTTSPTTDHDHDDHDDHHHDHDRGGQDGAHRVDPVAHRR